MALIVLSGQPSSGKSYRANQIYTDFLSRAEALAPPLSPTADASSAVSSEDTSSSSTAPPPAKRRKIRVELISDHSLHIRREAFAAANTEKTARATLSSAVKRSLGRDTVTIVDSGNYIKGFRYQLHCEAKAVGLRSCVVQVGVTGEKATELNDTKLRLAESGEAQGRTKGGDGEYDPYDPQVHKELVMRFEEPNPLARWDSPCFVVPWDDATPPCEQIWDQVVMGLSSKKNEDGQREQLAPVKPNAATVLPNAQREGTLHDLDRSTQRLVYQILGTVCKWPYLEDEGGEVEIEGVTMRFPGGIRMTVPLLQRLRRQFIQMQRHQVGSQGYGATGKGSGPGDYDRQGQLFLTWLGDALDPNTYAH